VRGRGCGPRWWKVAAPNVRLLLLACNSRVTCIIGESGKLDKLELKKAE